MHHVLSILLCVSIFDISAIPWSALIPAKRIVRPSSTLWQDEIINYVNNVANTTWQAGPTNRFRSIQEVKNLLGVRRDSKADRLPEKKRNLGNGQLPRVFDARYQWPYCKTIGKIRDQGICGSCWAFGAVESISDRICIHSGGLLNVEISAEDVLSCCSGCSKGCIEGHTNEAWNFWKDIGIVTGGGFGNTNSCRPYPFPECSHYTKGKFNNCSGQSVAFLCDKKCQNGYKLSYEDDKHYGEDVYSIDAKESAIMEEIYVHGPVEATYKVYEDFVTYKKGVYTHVMGVYLSDHAVKIIGWGVEISLTGEETPYWLIANSWNPTWGDKGFFKIRRGINECGIEGNIFAGIPRKMGK